MLATSRTRCPSVRRSSSVRSCGVSAGVLHPARAGRGQVRVVVAEDAVGQDELPDLTEPAAWTDAQVQRVGRQHLVGGQTHVVGQRLVAQVQHGHQVVRSARPADLAAPVGVIASATGPAPSSRRHRAVSAIIAAAPPVGLRRYQSTVHSVAVRQSTTLRHPSVVAARARVDLEMHRSPRRPASAGVLVGGRVATPTAAAPGRGGVVDELAHGDHLAVVRSEVQRAGELGTAGQPFGVEEVAVQRLQHVLPRPDGAGHPQDRCLAGRPGADQVRQQSVRRPVATADDVAGPRRRDPGLGAGPRAHDQLGCRLAGGVRIVPAQEARLGVRVAPASGRTPCPWSP